MQKRKIDELISHFNRKVADMDIDREYKMELLGMITAIGIACEKELSIEPERKKGKWISEVKGKKAIIDEYGNVTCSAHCSECGDWLTGSDEYACRGRFCPNCGAHMRQMEDDNV